MPLESDPFDADWSDPLTIELDDHAADDDAESFTRDDLQQLMWNAAGLTRDGDDLAQAATQLAAWRTPAVSDAKSAEDANLLVVARAVVASALARRESRGGHFRTDFPEPDPAQARHSAVQGV